MRNLWLLNTWYRFKRMLAALAGAKENSSMYLRIAKREGINVIAKNGVHKESKGFRQRWWKPAPERQTLRVEKKKRGK